MSGCGMQATILNPDGSSNRDVNGSVICGCMDGWSDEGTPHESGNGHIAGFLERDSGDVVFAWKDGTVTRKGQPVPDPRKDTNMSKVTEFTLPEQPVVGSRVKVSGKVYKRGIGSGTLVLDAWRPEGVTAGGSRSWAELFVAAGSGPITLIEDDLYTVAAKNAVPGWVESYDETVAAVAKALNDDPTIVAVGREDYSDAVGRVYRTTDLTNFTDLPEYVTQVTDRDGDVWSRTKAPGEWTLADGDAFTYDAGSTFSHASTYAPLTVKTVK